MVLGLKNYLKSWDLGEEIEIKAFDIEYETNRECHVWTVNEKYILKMYDNEENLRNNIRIPSILEKVKIPVQGIVKAKDGRKYIEDNRKYFVLFTKLQGEVIDDYFSGDYKKRGRYLGKCIASLHNGLKEITEELRVLKAISENNMYDEVLGWVTVEIEKYLENTDLPNEEVENFQKIRRNYTKEFKSLYEILPKQAIHRDMHGQNMIFKDEKLVGYIDFDLSQINTRVFDICYMGTGILSGCFDDHVKREKWLEMIKEIISGYDDESELSTEEREAIIYMFDTIEFIMIAYFAKDGYKEIADNNVRMINWINEVWKI